MDVHTTIPLKNYLTMKVGGPARFMVNASSIEELGSACQNARSQNIPIAVLGGGSNTLAPDEGFNGLVIRITIAGIEKISEDATSVTMRYGAGESWDEAVRLSVEQNLSGIEAMSAIPGTIGAAPVQNIGAYGQELADTFVSLEAYDIERQSLVQFSSEDCGFSYRHSVFRGELAGKYIITSVTLRLFKSPPSPPFYEALERYFNDHSITIFTPQVVRDAVSTIRAEKLPDPALRPNSGSFFKNAIIESWLYDELTGQYPAMPHYELGDKRYKIPTGWLIEQAGFKDKLLHGVRVNPKNCLVLINESATSYHDIAAARDEIINAVRDMFRITIVQEPLEIG